MKNKQSLSRTFKPISEQLKEKGVNTRKNKYNAKKVVLDGHTFDSRKEAKRYGELKLLERAGIIKDLKLQVFFELVPSNKKERGVAYVADFTYFEDGEYVVEDVKSSMTRKLSTYIIKRKLMLDRYGITIRET